MSEFSVCILGSAHPLFLKGTSIEAAFEGCIRRNLSFAIFPGCLAAVLLMSPHDCCQALVIFWMTVVGWNLSLVFTLIAL